MDKSLLGKLPPELRNEINGLLLPPPTTLKVNIYREAPQGVGSEANKDTFALASTCKDVATEALDMLYGHHSFVIVIRPYYMASGGRRTMVWAPRSVWAEEMQAILQPSGRCAPKAFRSVEVVMLGCLGTPPRVGNDEQKRAAGRRDRVTLKNFLGVIEAAFPAGVKVDFTFESKAGWWSGDTTGVHGFALPLCVDEKTMDEFLETFVCRHDAQYLMSLFMTASDPVVSTRDGN